MKKTNISPKVIRRLPRYLWSLDDLAEAGIERISSGELAERVGMTASQIRQDFSCFGEFGQQGYGYNVETLRKAITGILGICKGYKVILLGAGRIGQAVLEQVDFQRFRFHVLSAFDIRPERIGLTICDVLVRSEEEMDDFIREHSVDIAILCIGRTCAQKVVDRLITNGIRGIWNFTGVEVSAGKSDVAVESVHVTDSFLSLTYQINRKAAET